MEIDAVNRCNGDANADIKLGRTRLDRKGAGGGCHNTACQIDAILKGANVWQENPEFVASNPRQDAIHAQDVAEPVGNFA